MWGLTYADTGKCIYRADSECPMLQNMYDDTGNEANAGS